MFVQNAEKKFLDAYDRYADDIFRHCFFRLRQDRELAKDITQETFTKTWQYLAVESGHIQHLRAFLYTTASHLIIDYTRKKKEQSLDAMQESGFEPVDHGNLRIKNAVDARLLQDLLEKLPDEDREMILLRYVSDLPPREIAKILALSTNVISVRLTRAKKKLKELIRP